ncbi:hypothetical protein BJ878DRAFT_546688 [Calycina marina]|uniref:Uncharacterized protein n=1 Tax=Calycina marina TaxID=1763456 RepID=A0A9P7YUE6_9HELO|nr:hypothetical protein BJ878DRAFT_546688 [Calycina marina]
MRFPVEVEMRPRSPATTQVLNMTPSPTSSSLSTGTATADSGSSGPTKGLIAAIIMGAVVILLFILAFVLRKFRTKYKNPKYVPTKFFKRLWENWEPEPMNYRCPDTNDHLEPHRTGGLSRSRMPAPPNFDASAAPAAGVDRNTSVRSVMTLPAYHPSARESEQVLGREGERGGIDVVIEYPEGQDEEEGRREAEMEALYQVRLARRRENEEREERRRLRREAQERRDYVALRELRARARAESAASGTGRTVEDLRAEHERVKKDRQRAVSSVSYGDLGVARHDGTRLRANSNESEREGLLGDAASMAASSRYHRRDISAGSIISIETMHSDMPSPTLTRSRGTSRASRPESPLRQPSGQSFGRASSNTDGRAGSSPELIEHEDIPPNSPPGYENIPLVTPQDEEAPPDYTSPIAARGESRSYLFEVSRSTPESSNATRSQVVSNEATSSSNNSPRRGVDGESPQLPSLRLSALPLIHVDSPSPVVSSPGKARERP